MILAGERDAGPCLMESGRTESLQQQRVSTVIEFIEQKYKVLESEWSPDWVSAKDFCL